MNIPVTESVTLDTPIKRGDQVITAVSLRRPASGELRGLSLTSLLQMEVDTLQKVLPRITTPILTEPDVASLDPADLLQLGAKVAGFLVPKDKQPAASPAA